VRLFKVLRSRPCTRPKPRSTFLALSLEPRVDRGVAISSPRRDCGACSERKRGISLLAMTKRRVPRDDRERCRYEHSKGTWRSHSLVEADSLLRRWQRRNGEIASSGLASPIMTKAGITASEVQSPPSGDVSTRCSFPAKLSIFMIGLTDYYLCNIISRQKRENPLPASTFGGSFSGLLTWWAGDCLLPALRDYRACCGE